MVKFLRNGRNARIILIFLGDQVWQRRPAGEKKKEEV
jgi:hypothetical protein